MNSHQPGFAKSILKLQHPERMQVEMKMEALDDCLPTDHKARLIWDCVQSMNTDPCFRHLVTVYNGPGRKATNPEVLFALWLLAFIDGVVSSREIVELTESHDAYRWIRGGVSLNHDMLCRFRSSDPTMFEDLLASSLAVMQSSNLLSDEDFAQDGTRVQSAAGLSSGRREKTLLEYQDRARQRLRELEANGGVEAKTLKDRAHVAKLAAAKKRQEALDLAVAELANAQTVKRQSSRKKKEELKVEAENVRISPTDPESRKMKMGNGGFAYAYNVQVTTGVTSRAIYDIDISNSSDQGKAPGVLARVLCRTRQLHAQPPKNWIADAGYGTNDDIEGCYALLPECNTVFASKPNRGSDPKVVKKNDGPGVKKWRGMLATEAFATTYSQRCSTVELSNARLKQSGLVRFSVVGILQAKSQALLAAIAQNISICVNAVVNKGATILI